jgi:hypothetical protein
MYNAVELFSMVLFTYQSTQQFYDKQINISISLLCVSIVTCFDPVGSSSGNLYMSKSRVIGLITDMDPAR